MDRRSRRGHLEGVVGTIGAPCVDIRTDGPVLLLGGDLDVRSTGVLRAAIYDHLGALGKDLQCPVVIDLSGVSSIDATALKVIAAATRHAARYGVRVVLRDAGPAVRRMMHLTRLIRVMELERDAIPA
jgi:anti-anti-sigma factor